MDLTEFVGAFLKNTEEHPAISDVPPEIRLEMGNLRRSIDRHIIQQQAEREETQRRNSDFNPHR